MHLPKKITHILIFLFLFERLDLTAPYGRFFFTIIKFVFVK